jgi:transcriptional regulator with XRE-family HTH domain
LFVDDDESRDYEYYVPKIKTIKIVPNGRFCSALKKAVESHNLTLTELAQRADSTYEHMRKLTSGRAYPSRAMLRRLCAVLNADFDYWQELYERDKFQKEFGNEIPRCLKVPEEMKSFIRLLRKLSAQGRAVVLAAAKTLLDLESRSH